jgi:hypothetical protein
VRLALHTIGSRHSELDEACRQLLGLLALCPPVKVPWSLFDGVSSVSPVGESCMVQVGNSKVPAVIAKEDVTYPRNIQSILVKLHGQKKNSVVDLSKVTFGPHVVGVHMVDDTRRCVLQLCTSKMFVRGAPVHVNGESIDVVSPVGLECENRDHRAKSVILDVAGSKLIIENNGKRESIDCSRVTTEQGDLELIQGHCMLRLRSFHSIVGAECQLLNGAKGVIHNVVQGGALESNHLVHFKPHSLMFFPIWMTFLLHSIRACAHELVLSLLITLVSASLQYFEIDFDQEISMPVFANKLMTDMMSKCGSVLGLEASTSNRIVASFICFGVCNLPKRLYWVGLISMWICRALRIDFDCFTFLLLVTIFVFLRLARNFGAITKMTHEVSFSDVSLNEPAVTHNGHLCFKRHLGTSHYDCNGRVLRRHEADTVSVAFGCDAGACLLRAPRARICCVRDA